MDNEKINMDLLFSLTFHTGSNEEVKYSANLSIPSEPNDLANKFNNGWQQLEDQVFGKIEGFIANTQK